MTRLSLLLVLAAVLALAQGPPPDGQHGPPPGGDWRHDDRRGPPPHGPPYGSPPGKWWHDPELIRNLGLTADQQKRIDDSYQSIRLRLIDLTAALQKEEAVLEPMLGAEHVDEARALAQIDRVAQARADLERARARMLLGFRGVLNQEQWKRLQSGPGHPPVGSSGNSSR